jgi:hypothetical protein
MKVEVLLVHYSHGNPIYKYNIIVYPQLIVHLVLDLSYLADTNYANIQLCQFTEFNSNW